MTPLLPNPDHYLQNLIAMTSPEAKRLWRRAIKEHFGCTCVYCGETYELNELTLDHVHPRTCCRQCNQDKGSNNWLIWMRQTFGINRLREQLIYSHIN